MAFGLLDMIHWVAIKAPVSIYSLYVMFETSFSEAEGFINLKFSFLYIFLIVYLLISIVLLKKDLNETSVFNKLIFSILLFVSFIFLGENHYKDRLIRKGMPIVVNTIINFNNEINRFNKDSENFNDFLGELNATSLEIEKEQVTVIVIGESTNRNHMSLYDYFRETNPLLSIREDIYVFDNVISPYTFTQGSIRTSMTNSNVLNGIKFSDAPSIIAIARAANYKTYWLSNQSSLGIWENLIALLAKTSNEVLFPNKIIGSKKLLASSTYDEILLAPFSDFLKQEEKKKFIVIHLIGTHSAYFRRYPKKYNKFKKLKDEKSIFICKYDNAVLYNDFIVNSLIDTLKKHSDKNNVLSNLIYFSDHGEIVFDDGLEIAGHDKKGIPSRHQVEIPFIVWESDSYISMFPFMDSVIKTNKNKAYNNSNLFHSAIDLMHIKTDLFIDSLSVFNASFKEKERFIGPKGISYENKILKQKN